MSIPTSAYEPGFPIDWEGLDYQSAYEATPRLYGVSSGNGNDGVSHLWPDYYVRTCDPWTLARAATVSQLKPEFYQWALETADIDGEIEYEGISGVICDPPDDDTDIDHSQCEDGEDCEGCRECEEQCWSEHNGAWIIVDVFLIDDPDSERSRVMRYDSLQEAFSADLLELVKGE